MEKLKNTLMLLFGLAILPFSLFSETPKVVSDSSLEASATASQSWLNVVDKGHYPESWSQASAIMKLSIPRDEWVQILTKTRKPLGSGVSRQVVDQRVAKNPHGLPAGNYIVMFYKTVFSSKQKANELVTLYLEDGEWRVLTYQVS